MPLSLQHRKHRNMNTITPNYVVRMDCGTTQSFRTLLQACVFCEQHGLDSVYSSTTGKTFQVMQPATDTTSLPF